MKFCLDTLDINNFVISSCYLLPFEKNFVFKPHFHPRPEIMFIRSGDIVIRIFSNKNGKDVCYEKRIKDNQYIFIDSNVPHSFDVLEKTIIANVEMRYEPFTTPVLTDIVGMLKKDSPLFFREIKQAGYGVYTDSSSLRHCLSSLITLIIEAHKDEKTPVSAENLYLEKIYIQEMFTLLAINATAPSTGHVVYVRKASEFLKNNFTRDITLDDVAAYAGSNKYYLEKEYKKYTGNTIISTLLSLRCKMACSLLETTNLSINEIAQKCGFNIRQQLIYNFKKFYGVTPSEFVRQHKNSNFDFKPDDIDRAQTYNYIEDDPDPAPTVFGIKRT